MLVNSTGTDCMGSYLQFYDWLLLFIILVNADIFIYTLTCITYDASRNRY